MKLKIRGSGTTKSTFNIRREGLVTGKFGHGDIGGSANTPDDITAAIDAAHGGWPASESQTIPAAPIQPPPVPPWVTNPPRADLDSTQSLPVVVDQPVSSFTMKPRSSWKPKVVGAVAVALIVGLGIATFSYRSDLHKTAGQLADTKRSLADTRTELEQTDSTLATTKSELAKIAGQKKDLDTRVSELSNEKAKIQDERNASQELARLGAAAAEKMLTCRNELLDVMSVLVGGSYIAASSMMDSIVPICQAANSAVADFSDAAG